ncbi:phosphopantetheine-binding protein [Serratia ureilytica]
MPGVSLELPLSRNGKLDRKALPAPQSPQSQGGGIPSSLTEQRLCEYFADALRLPAVAPEANFFELGGNSLSAVDVAARINAGLGWQITIASIFAHPSARALAEQGQHSAPDMLDATLLLRLAPALRKTRCRRCFASIRPVASPGVTAAWRVFSKRRVKSSACKLKA